MRPPPKERPSLKTSCWSDQRNSNASAANRVLFLVARAGRGFGGLGRLFVRFGVRRFFKSTEESLRTDPKAATDGPSTAKHPWPRKVFPIMTPQTLKPGLRALDLPPEFEDLTGLIAGDVKVIVSILAERASQRLLLTPKQARELRRALWNRLTEGIEAEIQPFSADRR